MLRPHSVPPERRRRGDLVAAVTLVVALVATAALYWRQSAAANTESITVDPGTAGAGAPAAPAVVPGRFTEAWRAASDSTPVPVVAGPGVVTGDGSAVVGRDAETGRPRWSYTRDLPLCTVGEGFGRALALYRDDDYCSQLTALDATTGERAAQRNPDARPGTRFLTNGTLVVMTGTDYLEVFRSDLVKTLEYGEIRAPEQAGRQPRPGCAYSSFAMTIGRLAVLERCPTDSTDRLTVLEPDGAGDASEPREHFSVPLSTSGAQLLAVSADRALVALPGPPRLQILDTAGSQVSLIPLDVPDADLAAPPDGVPRTATDGRRIYWWTGSRTVALDRTDLAPLWTLGRTLGPGADYAGRLLLPVPDGLLEVDPDRGVALRTIPLDRGGWTGPVALATQGPVLLEQRGTELVALRPLP
ncbi:Rv3212 family protein [Pseudonocardia bannensis]|uniref:PQQ-binding-like beta-propeller repeat protein n=1 Tax=Pseudonocardia bannensis TaxID=630973 RepID=A0A848DM51_9PSEU|nr:PQQ-binding-like beta-propeller repeat protein [Pseudonocardia bannensis]NMH93609.1 PQQ-binding-like beta-propeller repeat protein [Pseudonocardia bannensis]